MLVWSVQNRLIANEIFLANNHKIRRFFTYCFPAKFAQKIPAKFPEIGRFFRNFVPKNPAKFDFFSTTYQKPCQTAIILKKWLFTWLYSLNFSSVSPITFQ